MTESTGVPALSEAVEERKRDLLLRYAKHGAGLMALASQKVISRTLWWGAWGALLGAAVFTAMWLRSWLVFPWPEYQALLTGGLAVFYVIAGAGCWGHAGMWRGLGRFAIAIGVHNGWVPTLLNAVFDKLVLILRKSERVDGAMNRSEVWLGDLPLDRWEKLLAEGVASVLGENSADSSRILRGIRRFVLRQIRFVLLAIVRKEIADGRGGGVSMERVREVAFDRATEEFEDLVKGLMNKQLLLMTALFLGLSAIAPLIAWQLGRT